MEPTSRRAKLQRAHDEARGRVPRDVPGPHLEVIDGGAVDSEPAELLAHARDRAAALTYSLRHRFSQYEQATSWLGRMRQWLDQRVLRTEAVKDQVHAATRWADEMSTWLQEQGPTATPAQIEEALARIEQRHQHAQTQFQAPDIARAPSPTDFDDLLSEAERPREQGPILSSEVVGAKCPGHHKAKDEFLGEYGQDGARVHAETGVVVQWDGNSSYEHSQEAAEIGSERLDEILSGLPDTNEVELIEDYINARWHEISLLIESELAHGKQGSFVVTAFRALPESGKLVIIKVGDSEIVMESPNQQREILPGLAGDRSSVTAIGAVYQQHLSSVDATGRRTALVNTLPQIRILMVEPGTQVTMYQASDGLYANTGKHLIDHVKGQGVDMSAPPAATKDDVIVTKTVVQF